MLSPIAADWQNSILTNDIKELDFLMVKLKLQDKEEGQGWTEELSNEAEVEYKRFLALKRYYPYLDIVPNKIVDHFWTSCSNQPLFAAGAATINDFLNSNLKNFRTDAMSFLAGRLA